MDLRLHISVGTTDVCNAGVQSGQIVRDDLFPPLWSWMTLDATYLLMKLLKMLLKFLKFLAGLGWSE
jgi:hypothetical protein